MDQRPDQAAAAARRELSGAAQYSQRGGAVSSAGRRGELSGAAVCAQQGGTVSSAGHAHARAARGSEPGGAANAHIGLF